MVRKTRIVIASLALATLAAASMGHMPSAHAAMRLSDLPATGLTLDSISPSEVAAGSSAQITISCLEGCDANASIVIGNATMSGADVSFDPSANTESFTLPDSVQPGVYDVTVYDNGDFDTLSQALTVDGPAAMSLASLGPDTIVAGSGAQVTIQCNAGCGPNDTISIGDADVTEESATYDAATNTESFTLPDTVDPGIYDVTVTGPDGRSDTLSQALTVEDKLTLSARMVNPKVHPGGVVRMIVQTNADANNWGASVWSAGWRTLPHVQIDYMNKGNGLWKVSFTLNKHVAPGFKNIALWASLGSQSLNQNYAFCVVR